MKDRIIFLDIDGVLNNKQDGTSYLCLNPLSYGISKTNFDNLISLVNATSSKIVFITSWRNHESNAEYIYNGMKFKSPFKDAEKMFSDFLFMKDDFLHMCPHLPKANKYKDVLGFFYLMEFLFNKKPTDFNYIILDDAKNQGLEQFEDRFFCLDPIKGLTKEDVEVISLFMNNEKNE